MTKSAKGAGKAATKVPKKIPVMVGAGVAALAAVVIVRSRSGGEPSTASVAFDRLRGASAAPRAPTRLTWQSRPSLLAAARGIHGCTTESHFRLNAGP